NHALRSAWSIQFSIRANGGNVIVPLADFMRGAQESRELQGCRRATPAAFPWASRLRRWWERFVVGEVAPVAWPAVAQPAAAGRGDKACKLANYFSTFRRFSPSRFLLSCRIIPLTQHSLTLELGPVGKAGRTGGAQPDHATKAKER